MKHLVEGAEPFLFTGNEIGCLLIHGFTGTPDSMRQLGRQLADRGYTVLGPRLYGHATREEDLYRVHYQDWIASVEDGFHLLRPRSQRLIAVGLSAGGVLALLLAAHFRLEGVVALSTPYRLPKDPRLALARPLSLLWPRVAKPHRDPNQKEHPPSLSYAHYPTWAIAEFNDMLSEMRRSLPLVTAPTLLLQSRRDASVGVAADAMEAIHHSLGSRDKRMIWLEGESHVITRDETRERVFKEITAFVAEVAAGPVDSQEGDPP